jgi:hypothetical protein
VNNFLKNCKHGAENNTVKVASVTSSTLHSHTGKRTGQWKTDGEKESAAYIHTFNTRCPKVPPYSTESTKKLLHNNSNTLFSKGQALTMKLTS